MAPASFTPTPEMLDAVAEWRQRRAEDRISRALVPVLQVRFGISASEAVAIIRAANKRGVHANAS
jgi:hypothetical protein